SVHVFGEISTTAYVNIDEIVRQTIKEIGYTDASFGFDYKTVGVHPSIVEQSADIAQGVNEAIEVRGNDQQDALDLIGAGDQGLMFGYANKETAEYMPLAISLSHQLVKRLADLRKTGEIAYLRPDAKSQVTVEYDENDVAKRIDTIVISTQHAPEATNEQIKADVIDKVIKVVIPAELLDDQTKYFINPTGRFVIGGPQGDSGLTGRKIIVDTYGGYAHHGGGAFSGKDATKVDRSASYAARYIAKNIVAAGLAEKAEIQLSYAIGVAQPISIHVDTFGTGKVSNELLIGAIRENFDLRPAGIIKMLDLKRPIYRQTAAYGHFGRTDVELPWEKLDKVEILSALL
ncbi:MAG: methionine adenosyltransferase, partial [Lactococcus sp.]|nr:methionine adenosyltransferase [Lactococcus sp.]